MAGPELLGEPWAVERIREKDQRAEVGLDRRHARDPAAKRLASSDHVMPATRRLDEDRDCALSGSTREVDGDCIGSATFETDHVGFHRGCVARGAMTEDDSWGYQQAINSAARLAVGPAIREKFSRRRDRDIPRTREFRNARMRCVDGPSRGPSPW